MNREDLPDMTPAAREYFESAESRRRFGLTGSQTDDVVKRAIRAANHQAIVDRAVDSGLSRLNPAPVRLTREAAMQASQAIADALPGIGRITIK